MDSKIDKLTEQYMRVYEVSHEHFEAIHDLVADILQARNLFKYAKYVASQHLSQRYSEHQFEKNRILAEAIEQDIDECEKFETEVDEFLNYSMNGLK